MRTDAVAYVGRRARVLDTRPWSPSSAAATIVDMRTIRASRLVPAPRAEVWALYDDIEHTPDWVPFSEEILFVSSPAGVGTVYRERTRLGGVAGVGEWTITHHDAPRRQVHISTDYGMDSTLIITMLDLRGRTHLSQVVVLRSRLPGLLGRLHENVFSFVARSGVESAVDGARRWFAEGRAIEAAPA